MRSNGSFIDGCISKNDGMECWNGWLQHAMMGATADKQQGKTPMKAMFYEAFEQAPEIRTVADPTPTEDGVVIAVGASGLCRSDWHGWMGHDPDIRLPHVPGHELAGRIVATGRGVMRFKVGDRVTVPFVSGCGHCGSAIPATSRSARTSSSQVSPIGGRLPNM